MMRFAVMDKGWWLDYQPEEMYGPRTRAFFESPKLSVRYVSGENDSFLAWVDEEAHYYTDHLVIHAVPWHFLHDEKRYPRTTEQRERSRLCSLWYVLGALMSASVTSYYRELYATGSLQGDYSHVYPETVKLLRIPRLDQPVHEPPDDWQTQLDKLPQPERAPEWLGKRLTRSEVASVLAAAAKRRQELAFNLLSLEDAFLDWMHAKVAPSWRWGSGESLQNPPTLEEFNECLQPFNLTFEVYGGVRDTFARLTDQARTLSCEAHLLERTLDAATAHLFST
jgi:hypothetical protein